VADELRTGPRGGHPRAEGRSQSCSAPAQAGLREARPDGGLGYGGEEPAGKSVRLRLTWTRATDDGRQLAQAFDVPNGVGLVISDRSGQVQAFSHQGGT